MDKKILIGLGILIAAGALFAGLYFWSTKDEAVKPANRESAGQKDNQSAEKPIFFFSYTCPHCKNVEKFVEDNNIKEKVQFESLEVSSDKANSDKFFEKAKGCGIPEEKLGVPMLWADGKCFNGEIEVVDYFKLKANIQ